jgi:hypothetical protein
MTMLLFLFFLSKQHSIKKKTSTKKVGGARTKPDKYTKNIYTTQKGKISPTRSNPVIEPNAKQTKTHRHNSASPTQDPKPNCKRKRCVKDATIVIISLTERRMKPTANTVTETPTDNSFTATSIAATSQRPFLA